MLKGGSAMNILTAGNALSQSQYLNNANYYLVLQNDCNLVLYNSSTFRNSQSIWSTNSSKQGNNFCTFQVDTGGFLSVYNASTSSGLSQCYNQTADPTCVPWTGQAYATGSVDPFFVMLRGDGTLDVYDFQNDLPKVVLSIYTNGSANNGSGLYKDVATPGQIWSSPPNSSPTPPSSLSVYGPYWDFVTRGHPFNVSYMPRGYYLSEGSLSSGDYFLTMEDNCTLQIIATDGSIIWQFTAPGNSHCLLTLQQNGTLQLQTNDTHEFVSNVHSASGDVDVDWILYLDQTGVLHVQELLNVANELWKTVPAKSSKNNRLLTGVLVAVIGGVLLIVIISVIWLYYAHASESAMEKPLTWRQRTTIILQVAEGIEYLHDKCSPTIIHRDVKTTNILLTSNMDAKVADFGLSKLRAMEQGDASEITTDVKGTPGYVDPEYHQSGLLTNKSDVYAFGIVMMEILTAQSHFAITRK
ncbi:unnamed protein product, partial [Sphagnum troendelagicum]